ncbi:dihydrodipicolinate synthase family protein, partial [Staphylococcus chromogenes]
DFLIYTGEDGQIFHAMNLGADGVISVASHTNGSEIFEMINHITNGRIKEAAQIQRRFLPKVNALFSVSSPAPVKAVLNYLGFNVGPLRLPLVACTRQEADAIINIVLDKAPKEYVTKGVLRPDY